MKDKSFLRMFVGVGACFFTASCANVTPNPQASATRPHELPSYAAQPTGGWYALNYPYYWNRPPVDYDDPYDYNGNYFPLAKPR